MCTALIASSSNTNTYQSSVNRNFINRYRSIMLFPTVPYYTTNYLIEKLKKNANYI